MCSRTQTTALLQSLFWFAVGISAATAAYAVLSARGLVYDGSFYLMGIAATRSFHVLEPARLSVQILQQLPAVLGARSGVENLWTLGMLFSLGMYGWPVALTALCWFVLPHDEKSWIAGPLINLVFAVPAANFIGISEGIIGSCLLWLALFLVMFRLAHPLGAMAAVVATLACAMAHEAAVLCLFLIGWSAATQFSRMSRFPRLAPALVAIISLAGAAYMARWILFPRSTIERADFVVAILGGFLGSPRTPNLPVIASLLAAVSITTGIVWPSKAWGAAIIGGIAILVCGVVFAAAPDALVSPGRFFASRGLPILLTTVLAGLVLVLQQRGSTPGRFLTRPTLSVIVMLVVSQALMQVSATTLWRDYVRDLRALVASSEGDISHDRALTTLAWDRSPFRREMLQTWSVQPLSILLAPGGQVRAMVEPAKTEGWVPYHLTDPRTLPRVPQLDWSKFPFPPS
ncbi:MAG TPA: hypothetical protein VKR31_11120 [Rhizomicrobium sp.]|nr:hypothetical protein [Rhizomicrobium sp.]